MNDFNLIDSPWIRVRWARGEVSQTIVGLRELFAKSNEITDLAVAPHERVSLVRLLVCLTQVSMGAPETRVDWAGYGEGFPQAVLHYLDRPEIHRQFNLFGDAPRFLQVPITNSSEPIPTSKLFPHLATGNTATLLDHEGGTSRRFPASELALALLTFQCFYPLYGAGYKGKGPCVDSNMAHAILRGSRLRKTIFLNCLDRSLIEAAYIGSLGQPLWELDEKSPDFEEVATTSYLGRLVPRHRSLWLVGNGATCLVSNHGHVYPQFEEAREPSATVIIVKDQHRLLMLRRERAIWRDLHSILVTKKSSDSDLNAPLVLSSHLMELEDQNCRLWVGGMIADKAKVLDTTESSFTLPPEMLTLSGRELYQAGMAHAELRAKHLWSAVKSYFDTMKSDTAQPSAAQHFYWHRLEQNARELIHLSAHPELLQGKEFGQGADLWTQATKQASRLAYEVFCPRKTPRQLEAFSTGLKRLYPKKKKTPKNEAIAASA